MPLYSHQTHLMCQCNVYSPKELQNSVAWSVRVDGYRPAENIIITLINDWYTDFIFTAISLLSGSQKNI